jgi:hypothetical protein
LHFVSRGGWKLRKPRLPGLTRKSSKERPAVWTPDRKLKSLAFLASGMSVSIKELSAAAASGRLRQCEIHDLRIAVEPGGS